ncbi:putative ATP-dependent helicase C23E6.02 [Hordeum vulgare]|nr:putative ATP-dependent helicase C23E6.02 [Hordeum vulgare]
MWSSGLRGDDGPEQKCCDTADAARKRSAQRYTNQGLEPSASLLCHEIEEYDRRQARLAYGASSSSGVYSSCTLLPPVKREAKELPPLHAVKTEHEAERPCIGVVRPKYYLPP